MPAQPKSSPSVRERSLTVLIHEVGLLAVKLFNRQIKDVGLTSSQWQVLYLLYEHDGQTQTELADHLTMAKPPLGKIVDRLEEDGWVIRRDDPQDRRTKRVFLTQKVTPLITPLEKIVDGIGDATTRGLTKAERRAFVGFLEIALKNLTEEDQKDV
ncbi:MAG: MarR family transcriptional regulator [Pseudomonadales bacterium]|jgi:DNA-binding MarR family transcriptional regulator|nr:MarR family transcriptional regulator [Pseudomonadales bacterium]